LATPKVFPKVPSPIIGLLISTLIGYFFFSDHIATLGSAYGGIPNSLPAFHLPELSWERIQRLIVPAFAIAVLGGIESLLSAVVADTISGTKHNSNKELIGQ